MKRLNAVLIMAILLTSFAAPFIKVEASFDNDYFQAAVYESSNFSQVTNFNWAISQELSNASIATLKANNPSVVIFSYVNFESIYNDGAYWSTFKTNGWLLRNSLGKYLNATDFPTETLVDMDNAGYQAWLVAYCNTYLNNANVTGIFADCFPRARVPDSNRIGAQTAINPDTGIAWTNDDWVTAELDLLAAIKGDGITVIGNGIPQAHDTMGYLANEARADLIIASNIDGLMIEGPTAWSLADYNSRSAAVFEQNLEFVKLVKDSGKICMFSNTGYSDLENINYLRYGYAMYLLNGYAADYTFKFRGMSYMSGSEPQALFNTDIGVVDSVDYTKLASGLFVREYVNYVIAVNPTAAAITYLGVSIASRRASFIPVELEGGGGGGGGSGTPLTTEGPSTIDLTYSGENPLSFKASGLLWCFYYSLIVGDTNHKIYYKTASNGTGPWSASQLLSNFTVNNFDLYYDGEHIHFAAAGYPGVSDVYYASVHPDVSGNLDPVTWQSSYIPYSATYSTPKITADSNGYPFIASVLWKQSGPGGTTTSLYIVKGKYNNGTWAIDISHEYMTLNVSLSPLDIVPLLDGKVMTFSLASQPGVIVNTVYSFLYDGVWEASQIVATDAPAWKGDASSYGDSPYFCYRNTADHTMLATYSGVWSTEVVNDVDSVIDPRVSTLQGWVIVFMGTLTETQYRVRYVNGTWGSLVHWITDSVYNLVSAWDHEYNVGVGLIWYHVSPSLEYRFALLNGTLSVPPAPMPGNVKMPPYVYYNETGEGEWSYWFSRGKNDTHLIAIRVISPYDSNWGRWYRRLTVTSTHYGFTWCEAPGEGFPISYYSESVDGVTWSAPIDILAETPSPTGYDFLVVEGSAVDPWSNQFYSCFVYNDTSGWFWSLILERSNASVWSVLGSVTGVNEPISNLCIDVNGVPHLVIKDEQTVGEDTYNFINYYNYTGIISSPVTIWNSTDYINVPCIDSLDNGAVEIGFIISDYYNDEDIYHGFTGVNGVFTEDTIGTPGVTLLYPSLICIGNMTYLSMRVDTDNGTWGPRYFTQSYGDEYSSGEWITHYNNITLFDPLRFQLTYNWTSAKIQGVLTASNDTLGYNSFYKAERNSWEITEDQPCGEEFSVLWDRWEVEGTLPVQEIVTPIDVTITGMEAGNWVFSETIYYTFTASASDNLGWEYLELLRVYFTDYVGHEISVTYNIPQDTYSIVNGDGNIVVKRIGSEATQGFRNVTATAVEWTFGVYFNKGIRDCRNITLGLYVEALSGLWDVTTTPSYFNIYHIGGFTDYIKHNIAANSNHPTGSDPLAMQVTGGSGGNITSYMIYKNLQHVNILTQIDVPDSAIAQKFAYNWATYYGMMYYIDGEWVNGWWATVQLLGGVDAERVHYVGLLVDWYQGNFTSPVRSETIYSFYRGGPQSISLWTDLWFSNTNSSSAVAGRISSEYFGMVNNSPWWGFWFSDWGPLLSNETQAYYELPLLNGVGNVTSSRDIELQVFYTGICKPASTDFNYTVTVSAPNNFDRTVLKNSESLVGIQTPPLIPPKVMDMPQGGMLGLLQFLVRNIASAIASALAPFFAAMTGSLDVLFGWAGWPGGFSQITGWISIMIAYMVTSMGWAMTMASTMFSFMTTVVPPLLWVIPQALTTYTQMIGMVWGYFTGLAGTGFDLWNDFAGPTWVYLAILLYPLYLLDLWATKGLSHVLVHIDLWAGIIRGLIDLGLGLATWVWNFVSGLIQDIPVI